MSTISSAWALQKSVLGLLAADPRLTDEIGQQKVFDRAPRNYPYPYVNLSDIVTEEWSTATEEGARHFLTFHVWSNAGGRRQVSSIAEALRAALHDQRPVSSGHVVINLQHERTELPLRRERDPWQAIVRFRATTEPE